MSVYMVPGVFGAGGQVLDSNGKPINGALINIYAAGTTSQVATYTTATGNVTTSNPIVTNADGRLPYEIWQSGGQAIKILLTDAVANTLGTYDNLYGINDPLSPNTSTGYFTLTSVGGTANAITANVSGITTVAANQVFLLTPASTNTAAVTINITPSGGNPSGAKNIFYNGAACIGGELVANLPVFIEYDGTRFNILGANYMVSSGVVQLASAQNQIKANNITAVTTLSISFISGNFVDVIGQTSTAVQSFDIAPSGAERVLRISGVVPFVHNINKIQLPTSATVTYVTGDVVTFRSISTNSAQWVQTNYVLASGQSLSPTTPTASQGASWPLLQTFTITNASISSWQLTDISNAYDQLLIVGTDLVPSNNSVGHRLQVSTQSGASPTYDSSGSYQTMMPFAASNTAAAVAPVTQENGTYWEINSTNGLSNNASSGVGFEILISNSTKYKKGFCETTYFAGNSHYEACVGGIMWVSTAQISAIKGGLSAGTWVTGGIVRLYGLKNS